MRWARGDRGRGSLPREVVIFANANAIANPISHRKLELMLDRDSRRAESEKLYERAVSIQERLVEDHIGSAEYQAALAKTLYEMGYLYARTTRRKEALLMYERVVRIQDQLVKDHPANADYRYDLTASLSYLGTLYRTAGRLMEAEEAGRRAVSVQEVLAANHPDVPLYRHALAGHCINQGNYYMENGRLDDAQGYYQKALNLSEKLVLEHPEEVYYVQTLGGCYGTLGEILARKNDLKEAMAKLDRSISSYEKVLEIQRMNSEAKRHLGHAYQVRAEALDRSGRHADAVADWERAQVFNDDRSEIGVRRIGRALAFAHLGDYRRALTDLDRIEDESKDSGEFYFEEARLAATCSAALLRDAALVASERETLALRLADRAMASLGRASEFGYFRIPYNTVGLLEEPDLKFLQSRLDFQALILDISFPLEPFAR